MPQPFPLMNSTPLLTLRALPSHAYERPPSHYPNTVYASYLPTAAAGTLPRVNCLFLYVYVVDALRFSFAACCSPHSFRRRKYSAFSEKFGTMRVSFVLLFAWSSGCLGREEACPDPGEPSASFQLCSKPLLRKYCQSGKRRPIPLRSSWPRAEDSSALLSFVPGPIVAAEAEDTEMSATGIPQNRSDSTRTSDTAVIPIPMTYGHPNTIREGMLELARVDRDIQELEGKLRALRLCRNLVVPISFIPPEIIVRFFSHLRAVDIPSKRGRSLGWIRVTHVCHHWRTIALETPTLWADVVVNLRRGAIEDMLRRAGGAPLVVRDFNPTESARQDVEALASHMSHIRVLDVTGDRHDLLVPLLDQISASATQLEVLRLRTVISTHLVLAGGLHPSTRPILRHLFLENTLLDWNSLRQLSSLVSLELIDSYFIRRPSEPTYRLTMSKLISILAAMPRLESLTLRCCLPPSAADADDPTRTRAILHHLSKLDITLGLANCAAILKRVDISPGAAILLHDLDSSNDPHRLRNLLDVLKAHALPSGCNHYLGIEVLPLGTVGLAMRGLMSTSASFYATFKLVDGKLTRSLPGLLSALPLVRVTSFELHDYSSNVRSKHWHQMLDAMAFRLPHARKMLIRGHNCKPFLGLLGRCPEIAPALEVLQVQFGSGSVYDVLMKRVSDEIRNCVSRGLALKRLELQSDASHRLISDWTTDEELTGVIPEIQFVRIDMASYYSRTSGLCWDFHNADVS
ncbi:hypothetical protein EVG20_g4092 [Dentipellis fragilis]|uniref:F-box domain-containing protein n=1 Tax=Dentipellis fragilis TaxID=205917 RepID=A0A4Y9YX94_9AGAM|nr:hypothetical protein EVG20_g4092 [Dentipellis fragilis]